MKNLKTPYYRLDEELLVRNLQILKDVKEHTGCKILLASKAFSMYYCFPLIGQYLDGVTSSGYYEARLGREEMKKEVHTYSPAFKKEEFKEIVKLSDHIVFNSPSQWNLYKQDAIGNVSCGLRVNPEYSEIETTLYDPCAPYSRLGISLETLATMDLTDIEGLHFHTMCEQGVDTLERTIAIIEVKFKEYLKHMKWLNFGGGHHITKDGYDLQRLEKLITHIQTTYDLQVYLEPGEAIAYQAGFLVTRVLDIVENGKKIAILDASAACHMPDVLEMPYRPEVIHSEKTDILPYSYILAGNTCLAGDVIGAYSFDHALQMGEQLTFCDMAIYTMVKNNTFNGVPLPSIVYKDSDGNLEVIKSFDYSDFKSRL